MSHSGTEVPGSGEHEWVARALAADAPGPIPPAVGSRIEDSLRAAAGATLTGERPQVFGGSAPARPSPFAAPPPARRRPEGQGDTDGGDTAGGSPRGRRSGSRRGLRVEAAQDRRHRLLHRLLPAAAAVVVVAGSATVAVNLLGGGGDDSDGADAALESAGESVAAAEAGPVPNGLVATGTAYSEAELGPLALGLVAAVGSGEAAPEAEALAEDDAAGGTEAGSDVSVPAADPVTADPVAASPLASAEAYRTCARELGAPEDVLPVAVDLATFEGTEAAVVVLPNRAGDGYEVIVTDRACNPSTQRATATVLAP